MSPESPSRRAGVALAVALAALVVASASGEEPAAPAEPASEADGAAPPPGRRQIEEIVVTAQKTAQNVHDVPISITVMDDEFLRREGVTDFHDAALHAPNTTVDDSGSFPDVRIRGFGSPLSNKAFEQSVGLAIDGISYGRVPYWQGPLFDLDRVEVLRGPQGTLFGKNTTAGLFNVVTKKPTDEFTGYLLGEIGELETRRFEGAIGGPIVPRVVDFRLSGLSDERDGLTANTTAAVRAGANERMNGRDRKGVRFQLALPDVAGANVVVGYEKVSSDIIGNGWEYRIVNPDELEFYREYDPATDVDPHNHRGSVDLPEIFERDIDTFVLNAGYDIGPWGLRAVAGHTELDTSGLGDLDFGPSPMLWTDSADENPQTTFELRLESPELGGLFGLERIASLALGHSRFTSGFFYERRQLANSRLAITINAPVVVGLVAAQGGPTGLATDAVPNRPILPGGLVLPITQETLDILSGLGIEESTGFFDQTSDALAGFSHLTWSPAVRWTVEPGLRFTYEKKSADWQRVFTKGTGLAFTAIAGMEEFVTSRDRSESAFTPQVALRYDWTDDVNVFAKWAKGYKAGGFNELNSNGREGLEYKAERVTAWETGSKMRLLDHTADLDLVFFWNDVTDMQVFTQRPEDLVALVENAGKARARGVELDGTWLATDWLTVLAGVGFNEAKYVEFPFGECPMDKENTDGDSDTRCDLSGSPLYQAPKWTALLSPITRFPLSSIPGIRELAFVSGSRIDLVGGGDVEYQDVHFTTRTDDPRTRQPSFVRLNANLGLENVAAGWTARITVKNLTDEVVTAQSRDVTLSQGSFTHVLEEPRLVVGSLQYRF